MPSGRLAARASAMIAHASASEGGDKKVIG
jgi:hypothetical protein